MNYTEDEKQLIETKMQEVLQLLAFDNQMAKQTANRMTRMWCDELLGNNNLKPVELYALCSITAGTVLPIAKQTLDVSNIHTWSTCKHHLMPYSIDVEITLPNTVVGIGLSKYARIVQILADRATLQEDLTYDIAQILSTILDTPVLCTITGSHTCCSARGAKQPMVVRTTFLATAKDDTERYHKLPFTN